MKPDPIAQRLSALTQMAAKHPKGQQAISERSEQRPSPMKVDSEWQSRCDSSGRHSNAEMLAGLNIRTMRRTPLGVVSDSVVNDDPVDCPAFASPPLAMVNKGGTTGQWIREKALAALSKFPPSAEPLPSLEHESNDADVWASPPIALQADTVQTTPLSWTTRGLAMAGEQAEAVAGIDAPEIGPAELSSPDALSPKTRREAILSSPTFLAFFNSAIAPSVAAAGPSLVVHEAQSAYSEGDTIEVHGHELDAATDADTGGDQTVTNMPLPPTAVPQSALESAIDAPQWWACFMLSVHEVLGCKVAQIE